MDNSTDGECSPFASSDFEIVAAISAASAGVSFLACLFVIGLIILLKKYLFFSQRLILYFTIATLLDSIGIMLHRVDYETKNSATDGFCVFIGFFEQNTAWSVLLAFSCITINLFLNLVFHRNTEKLEWVYFLTIFIFPLTFNWIPFIKLAYGKAGAWCWIRIEDTDNCDHFTLGIWLRFVLWFVPLYLILIVLFVLYAIILYTMHRDQRRYQGKYDPNSKKIQKMMQKEVRPLIWYPLIYLLLNIFPLINRIHDAIDRDHPEVALWVLHALFFPLTGVFIALVFTLDPDTLRRLRWGHLKAAAKELCSRDGDVREYPARQVQTESFSSTTESGSIGLKKGSSTDYFVQMENTDP